MVVLLTLGLISGDPLADDLPQLFPLTAIDVGLVTRSLLTADINSDDLTDLILLDPIRGEGKVLLGNLSESFEVMEVFQIDEDLTKFAVADLNSDGKDDLLGWDLFTGNFAAYISNDAGSLGFAFQTTISGNLTDIAVRDFNHDGRVDLFVLDIQASECTIFTNDGATGFVKSCALSLTTQASSIHVADFNADGLDDVLAARFDSLEFFAGIDQACFEPESRLVYGDWESVFVIGNLNNDALPDIVSNQLYNSGLSLLYNTGNFEFDTQAQTASSSTRGAVVLQDLDYDGWEDMVFTNVSGTRHPRVGYSEQGAFTSPVIEIDPLNAINVSHSQFVDVDLDGDMDFVSTSNDQFLTISKQSKLRVFDGFQTFDRAESSGSPFRMRDVNGDGVSDLLSFGDSNGPDRLMVARGQNDGKFDDAYVAVHYPQLSFLWDIEIVDLDLDGDEDVLLSGRSSNNILGLYASGTGTYSVGFQLDLVGKPEMMATGDINGDGYPDLAFLEFLGSTTDRCHVMWSNSGNGFHFPLVYTVASNTIDVALADMDGDELLDLVTINESGVIRLHRNIGFGLFGAQETTFTGVRSKGFRIHDEGQDGDIDIQVFGDESELVLVENIENNIFKVLPPVYFSEDREPSTALLHCDMDGNGEEEVIAFDGTNVVTVFERVGVGEYQICSSYPIPEFVSSSTGMFFRDLNADGLVDFMNVRGDIDILFGEVKAEQCHPDLTADGTLNFFDISAFLVAYLDNDPIADFNGDGMYDFFDVSGFLVAFNAGCP